MGRRTYFNRASAITYPSRVEGWLDVCGEYLFFVLVDSFYYSLDIKMSLEFCLEAHT